MFARARIRTYVCSYGVLAVPPRAPPEHPREPRPPASRVPPECHASTARESHPPATQSKAIGRPRYDASPESILAGRAGPPGLPRHASPKTVWAERSGPPCDLDPPRRRTPLLGGLGRQGCLATLRRTSSGLPEDGPRPLPPDCHPSATRLPPRRRASTHRHPQSRVTVRTYVHAYHSTYVQGGFRQHKH